jgi:ATP synthase protein I
MTTESKTGPRKGLSPVLGALGLGALAVLVLTVVAGLTDGRPAVVGASAGGVLTLTVFASGVAAVGFVARLLPGASLLVALLTYALQLLVLALVVAAIERADVTGATLSRGWFAAAVIVVALTWVVGLLVTATRQRIPLYDTPGTVGPVRHPGGER